MRKKLEILIVIVLLVGVIAGSQKVSEVVLSRQVMSEVKESGSEQETVIIDPGHGGGDPGKVGVNDALEKDINLSIAGKIKVLLEKEGIKVVMTRDDENGLANTKVEDLKKRVSLINETKPALAVSVHQNSYQQESVNGAQVFYFEHSDEGKAAALVMQEALKSADPENTRQAKGNSSYYLLKKTEIPTIIVECGFLSNEEEAAALVTEEFQAKMAEAVCDGILEYIK